MIKDRILHCEPTEYDDETTEVWRLACDCLSPNHVLDITLHWRNGLVECTFNFNFIGGLPWWWRLKQIKNLLLGRDVQSDEFILRLEDIPGLVDILTKEPHTGV